MTRWMMVVLAIGACGGDDDPGGGPGPGPGPGPDACSPADPDDCSGETICVDGACVAAFGRIYTFGGISVVASTLDANGEAWDAFGGAPDPFVEVLLNGELVLVTATADDVFDAAYGDEGDAEVAAGSIVTFIAYDEDVSANDPMLGCETELTADFLRGGGLVCEGAGGSVELYFWPR